jgi:hypothetical protein
MLALAERPSAVPGTLTFIEAPPDRAEVAETPPPTAKQLGLTGREAYVYTLEHPVRRKAGHGGDASAGVPSPEERAALCDAARVGTASPKQLFLEKHPGLFLEEIADRFAEPRRYRLRMQLAAPGGKEIVNRFTRKLDALLFRDLRRERPVDVDGEDLVILGLEALGIPSAEAHDMMKRRAAEDERRRHLAEFVSQCCKFSGEVLVGELYAAYLQWCRVNPRITRGEEPFSATAFTLELLKSSGVRRARRHGGQRCLKGISLRG